MNFRTKAIIYFAPVLLSIGITAFPLLTLEWVGLEKSLYLMYLLEFILSVGVVIFLYRQPWVLGNKRFFFKCLLLIISIQLLIYMMKESSIQSVQFPFNQALPLFLAFFAVPFYEECIYRGCLIDFLRLIFKRNTIMPIVLTSLIFSAMHTQYSSVLDFSVLFAASAIFSVARIKSGSLLPSIILHSLMNVFVIALNIFTSK